MKFSHGAMPPRDVSPDLVEECTTGTTLASLYRSRLGLPKSFKNPKELHLFWTATAVEVKKIATHYKSRKAIREALRFRRICLDEISKDCLETHGRQVWSNGEERPFVTSIDTPTTLSKTYKAEDTSRVRKPPRNKKHAISTECNYPRHLIYEDPGDQRKIRLQVSAWIIQRACRKTENDRHAEKTPQKATAALSFKKAVQMNRDKRTRSWTSSSDSSMDELSLEYPDSPRMTSKHTPKNRDTVRQAKPGASSKAHNTLQAPAKQRNNCSVSAVVSTRKPEMTKATGMASRKRLRGETPKSRETIRRSAQSNRIEKSLRTSKVSIPGREIPRRTTSATAHGRSVTGKAKANLDLIARQLHHDRTYLGVELLKLLKPQGPGRHKIVDMKRMIGIIETIALNDDERLRKALGNTYDKYKTALDRWLACLRTLIEFRETTGLPGDQATVKAHFESLPQHPNKARLPYEEMYQEISTWYEKDGVSIPDFSKKVGSLLLSMSVFGGWDMSIEELLEDMIPFTTQLMELFETTLPDSVSEH